MMRALAVSTVSVLAGAAVFAALWWTFLNTPESTVFMLALSVLLVLAMRRREPGLERCGLAWTRPPTRGRPAWRRAWRCSCRPP
ncbi:MAG: hypothetical protein R2712_11445 [Vicinamibacterales bacterium]